MYIPIAMYTMLVFCFTSTSWCTAMYFSYVKFTLSCDLYLLKGALHWSCYSTMRLSNFASCFPFAPSLSSAAMQSILQSLNIENPTQCPVCHKHLKTTQGLSTHLRLAKKCMWYKMGKLSELKVLEYQIDTNVIKNQEEEAEKPISLHPSGHHEQDPSRQWMISMTEPLISFH